MTDVLKLISVTEGGSYSVWITYKHTEYETCIGYFIVGDDGLYHWFPEKKSNVGHISAWLLRALADELDKLNKIGTTQ